ncbi:MAG: ABC transporter ATP-binding protein [Tidjanibacter sp.]|nr:ABC transporter ATP-binding protein [Tidjanibacter sp.]
MKKIFGLIPSSKRRQLPLMLLTALCSAVIDLVGIAALVSVLLVVLDENFLANNHLFALIYDTCGFGSERAFIVAVCIAVLVVIALKGVCSVALGQVRGRFMMRLFADLSQRMYDNYLSRGLLFVRSHHTTTLINNVNAMCHRFAHGVVSPLLGILTEAVVVVVLLVLLSLFNPWVVLLAVVVFVPVALVYSRIIRKRMAENGREENRLQVAQNKTMYEALRGYADIEIAGAKPYITARFARGIESLRHYSLRAMLMRASSSHVIEFSLVLGVVAVIIVGLAAGQTVGSLKVFLGVFAVAAYRIVPSISRIVGSWSEFKRNQFVVELLTTELSHEVEPTSQTTERLPFEREIRLEGVDFAYSSAPNNNEGAPNDKPNGAPNDKPNGAPNDLILNNFSLAIRKGEKVGIQGASGKGKTTLFNILAALFVPHKGALVVDDKPINTPELRRQWQNNIAYVSQDLFIPDVSIAENIAFGVEPGQIDHARLRKAIATAQLGDLVAGLPNGVDTITGEAGCRLSGGQRQRIGIARALYKEASVLMFDEATSSLDESTEREIVDAVAGLSEADHNLTILFISHNPKTLEFCDRVIEL